MQKNYILNLNNYNYIPSAISYTVGVDSVLGRASLYETINGQASLGGSSYTDTVTIETPGDLGRICAPPLVFAFPVSD